MTTLKKISLFLFALVLLGSCTKIVPIDRDGTGDSPIIIRGAEDGGDDLDAGDDGGITDPDDDGDDTLGGSAPGGITDADDDMDDDGSGDVITDPETTMM